MTIETAQIGRHHPLLTEFRRAFRTGLLSAENSSDAGLLAIEGPRLIGEAIRSGYRLEKVLFSRTGLEHHGGKLLPQLSKHTDAFLAEDAAFAASMDAEHPQGVAALVHFSPARPAETLGNGESPALLLAAAGVQDPGNLGTLIRAADAFGATGVIALNDTVSPFNPKSVRASAGSLFHLPVAPRIAASDLVAMCRERGVRMFAAGARSDPGPDAFAQLAGPVCLIIGQEGGGVPRALQRAADATIAIPMAPAVDSLNAGVAGSILLYEAARQRRPRAEG